MEVGQFTPMQGLRHLETVKLPAQPAFRALRSMQLRYHAQSVGIRQVELNVNLVLLVVTARNQIRALNLVLANSGHL